jgi:hypothetical protein
MQVDRAMCLITMEVQRDRHHRRMHPQERDADVAPEAQIGQTIEVCVEKLEHPRATVDRARNIADRSNLLQPQAPNVHPVTNREHHRG